MKRFLTLVLVVVASVATLSAEAIDDLYYGLNYGTKPILAVVTGVRDGVTSVIIPTTVTFNDGKTYYVGSISDEAFKNCSSLTSVTIPSSVTSIGRSAFEFCSSLTSVTIGNSVTSIGWNAFLACSNLISVTLPNSVTSIKDYTFFGCTSLTSITIPNSVTSIGYEAFHNCSSLTSVTIGNSVTSIGDFAFTNCSSLTSVTIPNSVTTIGLSAFYNCSGLTSITSEAVTPPACQEAFYEVDKSIPLYVPYSSVEAYKAADGWKEFLNIQPITSAPTAIEEMQSSEELKGTPRKVLIDGQLYILHPDNTRYNLQGMEVK